MSSVEPLHPPFDDSVVRHIGDPLVVVSLDRKLIYANRAAQTLFDLDEGRGSNQTRCCDQLGMSICSACRGDRAAADCGDVLHDYFVRRRGHDSVYCVSTSALFDRQGRRTGTIHAIKNMEMVQQIIDAQQHTEEALRLGEEKLRAILDGIADGVLTVEGDGRIGHFSRSMEQITGWSATDAIGRPCREVLRGTGCNADCPIDWTFREKKRVERYSETLLTRDGTAVPVYVTTAIVRERDGEGVGGVVCSFIDRTEVEALRTALAARNPFPELVGTSAAMTRLFEVIENVSDTDATVLIQGETGTGKELVARALHERSGRRTKPLVAVNCAALSTSLLESELFGHARGAFTGAFKDRKGRFEAAEGGTLFLDEISETPVDVQVKLLRFLQSKDFERVGDSVTRRADVRVIAASNRPLAELVRSGSFREDLFYRLDVIGMRVPPLRERAGDVPLLVEHFLSKHRYVRRGVEGISTSALQCLVAYPWPGNVRELENAVLRGIASSSGRRIERSGLPPAIQDAVPGSASGSPPDASSETGSADLRSIERARIVRRLEANNWHVGATAGDLGYSRSTLWRRMKELDVRAPNRKR